MGVMVRACKNLRFNYVQHSDILSNVHIYRFVVFMVFGCEYCVISPVVACVQDASYMYFKFGKFKPA